MNHFASPSPGATVFGWRRARQRSQCRPSCTQERLSCPNPSADLQLLAASQDLRIPPSRAGVPLLHDSRHRDLGKRASGRTMDVVHASKTVKIGSDCACKGHVRCEYSCAQCCAAPDFEAEGYTPSRLVPSPVRRVVWMIEASWPCGTEDSGAMTKTSLFCNVPSSGRAAKSLRPISIVTSPQHHAWYN
jgi:hypothetical protein